MHEVQPRSRLRQRAERGCECLGRGERVHRRWEVKVRIEPADEVAWGDPWVVVTPEARDVVECLVNGEGADEVGDAR
jgi:hypothetical protein